MLVRSIILVEIHESLITLQKDVDYDAAKVERAERKARIAKNEKQRKQNLLRAQGASTSRTAEIDKTLATTRGSTASMGK